MTELLKRWAELEPERCAIGPDGTPLAVLGITYTPAQRLPNGVLLAAVVEAIEARGLWWKLQRFGTNPHARAWVGRAELQYAPPTHEGPTPAAALLGAYLAALDAEAGQ